MLAYLAEYNRYLNIVGIVVVFALAWIFSSNRKAIKFSLIRNAFLLQCAIAFFTLRTALGQRILNAVAAVITKLYLFAEEGARFIFGSLVDNQAPWGFLFAFRVLPIMIFFGALMALLLHFRIIQRVTAPITKLLYPILGTSAAETLCTVANSFLGQTEAPLLIRSYLATMTKSEMLTIMVAGMGTMSGPMFSVYGSMGIPIVYLLSASVMSIPATILISKMLLPEEEIPQTQKGLHVVAADKGRNVFDALASGTHDGLQIALAIGAVLVAFVALIAFSNSILSSVVDGLQALMTMLGSTVVIPHVTLEGILGFLFAPIGWLFGVSWNESFKISELLGLKLGVNELVAYMAMMKMHLSQRAVALATFALCGFASFSSIGIQIAGIGALAPEQRGRLSTLGLRALLGGTLANLLNAFLAGLLL